MMVVVMVVMIVTVVVMVVMVIMMMVLSQNQRSFRNPLVLRPLGFSPQDICRVGNRIQQFCKRARRSHAVHSVDRE